MAGRKTQVNMFIYFIFVYAEEFFAHLYTSNPNAHSSNNLQMVQDEILQFSDAAPLNEKNKHDLHLI